MSWAYSSSPASWRSGRQPPSSSRLVTAPTTEHLGLALIKGHLKVIDFVDDDPLIEFYAKMAREYVETDLGWAIMPQTWDQWWDWFPGWRMPLELARQPVISVTSVTYTDSAGVVQTLDSSTYTSDLNSDPPRIVPVLTSLWPSAPLAPVGAIKARTNCGYADPNLIPRLLDEMVLLLTGHWYENRADVEVDSRIRGLVVPREYDDLRTKFLGPLMA